MTPAAKLNKQVAARVQVWREARAYAERERHRRRIALWAALLMCVGMLAWFCNAVEGSEDRCSAVQTRPREGRTVSAHFSGWELVVYESSQPSQSAEPAQRPGHRSSEPSTILRDHFTDAKKQDPPDFWPRLAIYGGAKVLNGVEAVKFLRAGGREWIMPNNPAVFAVAEFGAAALQAKGDQWISGLKKRFSWLRWPFRFGCGYLELWARQRYRDQINNVKDRRAQ